MLTRKQILMRSLNKHYNKRKNTELKIICYTSTLQYGMLRIEYS